MHAVHLPPRHLWRSAMLAALLALAFTALLLTTATQLSTDSSREVTTPPAVPQVASPDAQPSRLPESSWLEPLAIPRPLLEASRAD
jgi:hypothetical protein